MEITEKLYIERLEKMVSKYKKDPCSHCPMIEGYGIHRSVLLDYGETSDDNEGGSVDERKACVICRKLIAKYNSLPDLRVPRDLKYSMCPCGYFEYVVFKDKEVPKGHMVKVALNAIQGWRKDNKEK